MPKQVVVFTIGEEFFGADIQSVEGIYKMQQIRPIPNSPEFVQGVIDVRGSILPVIDLAKRFNMPTKLGESDRQIILVNLEETHISMSVDEIIEVKTLQDEIIDPPSNLLTTVDEGYITGIAKDENHLIVLINLAKVLTSDEQYSLSEAKITDLTPEEVVKMSGPFSFTNSKGRTYILHQRERVLKSGKTTRMFFFAKEAKEGAINAVPDGYVVSETKNGLPVLKKAE